MSQSPSPPAAHAAIGSLSLLLGVALVVGVVAVRLEGSWDLPAGLIRRNPVIMAGLAIALILAGSRLLWQLRQVRTNWTPTRPGRRFHRLVLYTKPDCLLCEEASQVLAAYRPWLPESKRIDVTTDPALQSKYGGCVPVVEIDGRKRFTGHVNQILLRRLIEGTPPFGPDPSGER